MSQLFCEDRNLKKFISHKTTGPPDPDIQRLHFVIATILSRVSGAHDFQFGASILLSDRKVAYYKIKQKPRNKNKTK